MVNLFGSLMRVSIVLAFFVSSQVWSVEKQNVRNLPVPLSVSVFGSASSNGAPINEPLRAAFGLSNNNSLQQRAVRTDKLGNTHTKYQQYYKDIPVWGESVYLHHSSRGEVRATGNIIKGLDQTSLAAAASYSSVMNLSVGDALNAALLYKKHNGPEWQIRNAQEQLIIFLQDDLTPRKAYLVNYVAESVRSLGNNNTDVQITRPFVILDEENLTVLKEWEGLNHAEIGTGPGGNEKTGIYEYGTDYGFLDVQQSGNTCTMDSENVKTVNLNHGTIGSSAFSYTCPRNTVKQINGAYSPLNDAHFFGNLIYDMFDEWLNVAPLSFKLEMKVHYGTGYENAFWDGSSMTFGDGASYFYPLIDINVASHEVAHGFTEQNSGLIYSGQSGGMNEAFSDIAGEAAEFYLKGAVDWFVGSDAMKNADGLRFFEDPTRDRESIGHADNYYDGMDVHYSSGVYNRAFYLLSNTPGWNVRKAFEVFAYANMNYWGPNETFDNGACGVLEATKDLRYNATEVDAAFQTVGVDCGYIPFVDIDLDGMDDNWELSFGLDPTNPNDAQLDLDNDGLNNLNEYLNGAFPNNVDSDGDGLNDGLEVNQYGTSPTLADTDSDGLSDFDEINTYSTNPLAADTDGDSLPDQWEVTFGLNPLTDDSALDGDDDGLTNAQEFLNDGDPGDSDTDDDGLTDPEELALGTLLNNSDSDSDGLSDSAEANIHGTNPLHVDSDLDGMGDNFEVTYNLDPLNSSDATQDLDEDGYTNLDEAEYRTDPTDPLSRPNFQTISFEDQLIPVRWTVPEYYESAWGVGSSDSQNGDYSLNSQVTNSSQIAVIDFTSEFQENSLSFWVKTQSGSCCDYFVLYIDDEYILSLNGSIDWTKHNIDITEGVHTIRFEYSRDSYGSSADSQAWIDNIRFIIPDEDEDGMPNAWEDEHGFDRNNPNDALTDFDGDSLSNLQEYQLDTNPALLDTDEDGLSDGAEVNTHGSSPTNADTDADGMPDGYEISYGFDLLDPADGVLDSDGDGFSNSDEFELGTDPNDANDRPVIRIISFESDSLPRGWGLTDQADAGWMIDSTIAQNGFQSLRADSITHNQRAEIEFTADFAENSLSFWSKTSTESCCDRLRVYVDGLQVISRSGSQDWIKHDVAISSGIHTIRFAYTKDGSVNTGSDTVWIDNIRFIVPDEDGDGMSDTWEQEYGLDINDPSDALTDLDGDGLNNLEEYSLDTDPTAFDTDGDGLSDGDEVNVYATSPLNADSDGDLMSDGFEVTHGFDPLDASDGALDFDGDGYSNATEFELNSDPRDANDRPQMQIISFENAQVPVTWSVPENANAGWEVDTQSEAHHGSLSLKSSVIYHSQTAQIEFTSDFAVNSLSFWSKTSTQSCCDLLYVYIDDVQVLSQSGINAWTENIIPINKGIHTIRFAYTKSGSTNSGSDTVWIDNIRYIIPDIDGDGMSDSWEDQYGLDKNDPSDAALDLDGDTLSNLQEHVLGTDPTNTDTDGDSLSDSLEVNVHGTSPVRADSDGDGMTDDYEIANAFDPLDSQDGQQDTDGDGYSNADESESGTNPRDAGSSPNFELISFTDSSLSSSWIVPEGSVASWGIDATESQHLTGSLKAEYSNSYSRSKIEFSSYFEANSLSFWTKMVNDSCCNYLYVYIDGRQVVYTSSYHDWTKREVSLTEGFHTVRFEYRSSASSPDPDEGAWIDNIRYIIPDDDGDGLPNSWEDDNGLDRNDASDANTDLDGDLLTNTQEFNLGLDPNNVDTDGDSLSDGDEYSLYGTAPHLFDSDEDGMNDGFEIRHSFDPLNASDGPLDTDSDGFTNADESEYDTDPRDPSSFPQIELTSFNETQLSDFWSIPEDAESSWEIDAAESQHLTGALKAQDLADNAIIEYTDYFESNSLSFWTKNDISRCCSYLYVFVDGRQVLYTNGSHEWTKRDITLSEGKHTIRFVADFPSSGVTDGEGIWIDNFRYQFPDDDGDGMPNTWEDQYGLDRNDASDAHLDLDGDTLDNLMEYHLDTDPSSLDSDGDLISDIDEINIYGTAPNQFDSDQDGMGDGFEIQHGYDPLNSVDGPLDTDGDGFTNADEGEYGTDPRDPGSFPSIELYTFSETTLPVSWEVPEYAFAGWQLDVSESQHLSGSLRAVPAESRDNRSIIEFTEYFGAGAVTFWSKMSQQWCCGYLYVYLDGRQVLSNSSEHDWTLRQINLNEGWHTLRFEYRVPYSYTEGDDVWIDNLRFQFPDSDGDGMPNGWEDNNGLDKNNAADASTDLDSDGLSNLIEFQLRVDPNLIDTDGDSLSDGVEVNVHGTDPGAPDSDADGMDDGYELANNFDPLDAVDGGLDTDGDGFTNADEFELGTDPRDRSSQPRMELLTFSDNTLPAYWVIPENSKADWVVDSSESQHLTGSLRAQNPNSSSSGDRAIIEFSSYFEANSLSFWTKMDGVSCCNYFYVYVDNSRVLYASGSHDWTERVINISEGQHTVRFEFSASTSSESNSAWIDNFRYRFPDTDGDGLPNGWEDTYGLNKTDASDALLDLDNDTLTNLQEYQLGSDPSNVDSDSDGLNDGEEFNVYGTSPILADTDDDGMPDAYEITQAFNPLDASDALLDFDGDGYSNADEYSYGTDPKDATDKPVFRIISFEDGLIPDGWVVPVGANDGWEIDNTTNAQHGIRSLRASQISHSQKAQIEFTHYSDGNSLSFWLKTSTESCCDYLNVYVDGSRVISRSGALDWEEHVLVLSDGNHTIRFEYYKDSSVNTADDTVWVDNIRFITSDTDRDGMPDYWEDQYGLDKTDPTDALEDADTDGLDNITEFSLTTNPILADTDGDGLNDGEEVLVYGTDPILQDTDADGVNDSQDAFPLNAAASIDGDGDGYPDQWNTGCGSTCRESSGLTLDWSLDDFDNDGLVDANDTDNTRDSLGPRLIAPADILITATGIETTVDLGEAFAEDFVDGPVAASADRGNTFESGHHVVEWSATDASGNTTRAYQNVDIIPLVSLTVDSQLVEEGQSVVINATLSGDAPEYPVVVPFIIDGSSSASYPDDHNAKDSYFVFDGTEGNKYNASYQFTVHYEEPVAGEPDEIIVFNLVESNRFVVLSNASLSDNTTQTITILEVNERPVVSISLMQNDIETNNLKSDSMFSVNAIVADPNPEDVHSYEWYLNGERMIALGAEVGSFEFNAADLLEGANSISVIVNDNGSPSYSAEASADFNMTIKSESKSKGGASSMTDLFVLMFIALLYGGFKRRERN